MMELYQLYSRQKPITSNSYKKRKAAQEQQIAIQENESMASDEERFT